MLRCIAMYTLLNKLLIRNMLVFFICTIQKILDCVITMHLLEIKRKEHSIAENTSIQYINSITILPPGGVIYSHKCLTYNIMTLSSCPYAYCSTIYVQWSVFLHCHLQYDKLYLSNH